MPNDHVSTNLDMVRRRELSDLAYREGSTGAEMLRLLIDREYAVDLQEYIATMKPGSKGPPPGAG